jgi:hypothetical protein
MTTRNLSIEEFARRFGLSLMPQSQAQLAPELRTLHRQILSHFVDAGVAPDAEWIGEHADALGLQRAGALQALAEADLVHTAQDRVVVAYPFSGTPTPHQVHLAGGPSVWAMCGDDALGIPLMVGRDAIITTQDPVSGEAIRIEVTNETWIWEPRDTVMLAAGIAGCATAAEATCRHIHFFTSESNALSYLQTTDGLEGEVYDQPGALDAARTVFGDLLAE